MSVSPLTVYTTVFGNTDPLYDSAISSQAKFVCFTDNSRLRSSFWQVIYIGPVLRPNRQSRIVKALSQDYTHTEWSLWMDCNFTLKVDPETLIGMGEFVNFRHPFRDTLADEAHENLRLRKVKAETLQQQMNHYRKEGFNVDKPLARGLSNNGVILRHHTPKVLEINNAWKAQHDRYTLRDQLCLDYVFWKAGFTPQRFPGTFIANDFFKLHKSTRQVSDF